MAGQDKHKHTRSWKQAKKHTHKHTNAQCADVLVFVCEILIQNCGLNAWPYSHRLFVFVCIYAFLVDTCTYVNPGERYLCGEFQWAGLSSTLGGSWPTSREEICHRPGAWETTEHPRAGNIVTLLTNVSSHTVVTIPLHFHFVLIVAARGQKRYCFLSYSINLIQRKHLFWLRVKEIRHLFAQYLFIHKHIIIQLSKNILLPTRDSVKKNSWLIMLVNNKLSLSGCVCVL